MKKYIAIVIALVMVAVAFHAAAAETKIGNIEEYTGARDKWEAQDQTFSLMKNDRATIEIEYGKPVNGTITEFKLRIIGGNGKIQPEWFDLHINGENAGQADEWRSFTNPGSDETPDGATCRYLLWSNISEIVDGNVVFEIHKPSGRGSENTWFTYALYYGASEEYGVELDIDKDGTIETRTNNELPNGAYDGEIVTFYKSIGKNAEVIYEFTYTDVVAVPDDEPDDEPEDEPEDEPDDEPDTPPVITNTEPEITLISPADGENQVNKSEEIEFIAQINDNDGDKMSVFLYNAENNKLLGYKEIEGSTLTKITVEEDTFEYGTTYDWYVKVIEQVAGGYIVESETYSFTTADEPMIPEPEPKPEPEPEPESEAKTGDGIIAILMWPLIFLVALIVFILLVKFIGKRKKSGKKFKLDLKKYGLKIKEKTLKLWSHIIKMAKMNVIISLAILLLANLIILAFRAGTVWHLLVSAVLIVVLYFYYNKKAYSSLRQQKDRFLMKFLSKEAKAKKTEKKSKA